MLKYPKGAKLKEKGLQWRLTSNTDRICLKTLVISFKLDIHGQSLGQVRRRIGGPNLSKNHPRPMSSDLLFWLLISKGPSLRLISSVSSIEVDLFCFQLLVACVASQLELQLLDSARQSLTVQYRYVELEDRKLKTAALKAANGSYPEEWIRIRFLKIQCDKNRSFSYKNELAS